MQTKNNSLKLILGGVIAFSKKENTKGDTQVNRANPSKFLAFTWLLVIGLITATNVVVANTDISAVTAAPIKPDRVILLDVAMAGKRIVAVGERGVVLLSDDNGKTWTSVRAPVTRTLTAVTFFDDKVGIAVGKVGKGLGSFCAAPYEESR